MFVSYPPSLKVVARGTLVTDSFMVVPVSKGCFTVGKVRGVCCVVNLLGQGLGTQIQVLNYFVAGCGSEEGLSISVERDLVRTLKSGIFRAAVQGGITLKRTRCGARDVFSCTPSSGKTGSCEGLIGRFLNEVGGVGRWVGIPVGRFGSGKVSVRGVIKRAPKGKGNTSSGAGRAITLARSLG